MINKKLKPWLAWIIPLCFCAFQFVLRLFPGNVQTELMNEFNISAASFGTFAAAYYLGYGGLQIPMAIFMEKYGSRLVVAFSALLCAIGCALMVVSSNWYVAIFSRFLVGAGSVSGFLGTTKAIIDWFPVKHHTKMIGISMSIGLFGALYGGRPVNILVQQTSWKTVLTSLSIVAALISVITFLFVRTPNTIDKKHNDLSNLSFNGWVEQVLSIVKNPVFVAIAAANFLMVGCLEGFADVWGINYLVLNSIERADASLLASLIFFGMMLGTPVLSYLADITNAHFKIASLCGLFMALSLSFLLLAPEYFNYNSLKMLMIFLGFLSGYQALIFVIGEKLVPKSLSNTSIATLNCINMFGGAFFHESIGVTMDMFSICEKGVTGAACYTLSTYTYGLAVIPAMSLIGGILLFIFKRK